MKDLSKLADVDLPLPFSAEADGSTLYEATAHLRRPFAPAAVRWKVQSEWGSGGLVVAYIDNRLVIERLNAIVPGMWSPRFEATQGGMLCHLSVDGVTRVDVGVGAGQQALKAMYSDAMKRAGVQFGVGVSIYAMAAVMLNVGDGANHLTARKRRDKTVLEIGPGCKAWLADTYGRWLDSRGGEMFGPALDHGDELDSQGAEVDGEAPSDAAAPEAPPVPPMPEDDRTRALVAEAQEAFDVLREADPVAVLPAVFRQRLEAAWGSHETLGTLVADLSRVANAALDDQVNNEGETTAASDRHRR